MIKMLKPRRNFPLRFCPISQHVFCMLSVVMLIECNPIAQDYLPDSYFSFPAVFVWKQQRNKSPEPMPTPTRNNTVWNAVACKPQKLHLHSCIWPGGFYLIACPQTRQFPITYSLKSLLCRKQHQHPLRKFYRLWYALILTSLCVTSCDLVHLYSLRESIAPSLPMKSETFV